MGEWGGDSLRDWDGVGLGKWDGDKLGEWDGEGLEEWDGDKLGEWDGEGLDKWDRGLGTYGEEKDCEVLELSTLDFSLLLSLSRITVKTKWLNIFNST